MNHYGYRDVKSPAFDPLADYTGYIDFNEPGDTDGNLENMVSRYLYPIYKARKEAGLGPMPISIADAGPFRYDFSFRRYLAGEIDWMGDILRCYWASTHVGINFFGPLIPEHAVYDND